MSVSGVHAVADNHQVFLFKLMLYFMNEIVKMVRNTHSCYVEKSFKFQHLDLHKPCLLFLGLWPNFPPNVIPISKHKATSALVRSVKVATKETL